MRRAPSEVYAELRRAGFDPAGATVMTAIAGAESGYDDAAVGDVQLQDGTWGPSYGLFQIRTIKGATGSGADRDINALADDTAAQAKAAWDISSGGTNFAPWTTFTTGAYRTFLTTVADIAGGDPGGDGPFPTWGPEWLPWNWPSNAANATANGVLGGARSIVVEGVFVVLGLALVAAGGWLAVRPSVKQATGGLRSVVGL